MKISVGFVAPLGDGRSCITVSNGSGMFTAVWPTKAEADKWRKFLQEMFGEGAELQFPAQASAEN